MKTNYALRMGAVGLFGLLSACASPRIQTPYIPVTVYDASPACEGATFVTESPSLRNESGKEFLREAALVIAASAKNSEACHKTLATGHSLFAELLSLQRRLVASQGDHVASENGEIRRIQYQITRLWREDQSARRTFTALATDDRAGAAFWAERLATWHAQRIDEEASALMSELLDEWDWIDTARFGDVVSDQAWLLVQHADRHPSLQARALQQLLPYYETGLVKLANYAYLWDRVAVNSGQLQRYGTQPIWDCSNGQLQLQPIEDPASVDARREALGMEPVEIALSRMTENICGR